MATVNYTVYINSDTQTLEVTPSGEQIAYRGDTISIYNSNAGSMTVSGFSSQIFATTSNMTYGSGVYGNRGIKSDASFMSSSLQVSANVLGSTQYAYIYFKVIDTADDYPDPLYFTNLTDLPVGSAVVSNEQTITGINVAAYSNISNGKFSINGRTPVTIANLYEGDKVKIFATSPSGYNQSTTVTFNTGSRTTYWTISNLQYPPVDQVVPLGITSGTLTIRDLARLFKNSSNNGNSSASLKEFLKIPGGSLVPNIAENANVPSSLPIYLSDFYGSATAFYVDTPAESKNYAREFVIGGDNSYELSWTLDADFDFGFGDIGVELSYLVSQPDQGSIVITSESGSPGTYSSGNRWIKVDCIASVPDSHVSGEVTIRARPINYPTYIITQVVSYSVSFHAPEP